MNEFDEQVSRLNSGKLIKTFDDYSVVNAAGGCNFVVDKLHPHLGGNLEHDDCGIVTKTLWPWVLDYFKPQSFLDVGCSDGVAVEWFVQNGVSSIGIEGLQRNVDVCSSKHLTCYQHDYTEGPFPTIIPVDIVWCSDVIEHIEEQYLPNIFDTFRFGKTLIISHGLEEHGSQGWHHVTNRPHQWWIDKIVACGFEYDHELSIHSREVCKSGWYSLSGKIFKRI